MTHRSLARIGRLAGEPPPTYTDAPAHAAPDPRTVEQSIGPRITEAEREPP